MEGGWGRWLERAGGGGGDVDGGDGVGFEGEREAGKRMPASATEDKGISPRSDRSG